MAIWSLLCSFAGLGFAAGAGGFLALGLDVALAAAFLLLGAIVAKPAHPEPVEGGAGSWFDRLTTSGWQGLAACAAGLLLLPASPDLRLFAAALWLWGLGRLVPSGRSRAAAGAMAAGSVLAGALVLAVDRSAMAWHLHRALSFRASEGAGALAGRPLSLGPPFSGIDLAALSLCLGAAAWARAGRRRIAEGAAFAAAVSGAWLAYLLLLSAHPAEPVHLPLAALPLFAVPTALFLRRWVQEGAAPALRPEGRALAAAAAAAILGVGCLTTLPSSPGKETVRVALYEKGFLNWMSPTRESYGSGGVGMFGNLPRLVEAMGWESAFVQDLSRESLEGFDLLFLANPEEPLPAASLDAIGGFVRGGGGLLLLGDHTWWKGGRIPLNDLLEGTAIRFAFDSAVPFVGGWLHSHRFRPHPAAAGLSDAWNEAGSVVGASLSIRYPAVPLVVGRFGYADAGDLGNPDHGFLGSLRYEPGERLGDVVLSAAQTAGRGRVLAVGDTSGFANGVLIHSWPFAERALRWLASDGAAALPAWREGLGLLLLALAASVTFRASLRLSAAVPALAAAFLLAGWGSREAVATLSRPLPLSGPVAVVDHSHGGRSSMEGWREDGILGLFLNLMREGYFAIGSRRFDGAQLGECALWTVVSPTRPYTDAEAELLASRVRGGMTLLVAAGWDDRAAVGALLGRLGLSLSGVPLGPGLVSLARDGPPSQVHFLEAWPVDGEGVEPLAFLHGRSVAVRKRIGKGEVVWIADAEFPTARNLEGEDAFARANVEWFQSLVRRPKEEGR